MDDSSSSEDGKPSAREAISPVAQAVVLNKTGQKDEAANSRRSGNTKEFYHALNHLPTERIPSYTREFDSILTFPEKFMLMIVFVERASSSAGRRMEQEAIHWAANGTAVVVRDPEELYLTWLRRFFGNLKYDSFIRKVYRWGFRKSPPNTCDLPQNCHVFSHPYFCRDQLDQLCEMKSTPVIRSRSRPNKPEATKPYEQSQAIGQNAVQAAAITANSLHTLSNPLRSLADMPQFYLAPQIPNEASILAQQLLNLQTRALLSNSMLRQSHNDAALSADALQILRLRLQLNQPLVQPSVEEMLQLFHDQNASNQIPSSVASVEELLRLLRQNPPR